MKIFWSFKIHKYSIEINLKLKINNKRLIDLRNILVQNTEQDFKNLKLNWDMKNTL